MVITTRIYAWLMILGVIRHRYILGGYHHQPAVGAFQWFLALQKEAWTFCIALCVCSSREWYLKCFICFSAHIVTCMYIYIYNVFAWDVFR